jgi:hypothetical protein
MDKIYYFEDSTLVLETGGIVGYASYIWGWWFIRENGEYCLGTGPNEC